MAKSTVAVKFTGDTSKLSAALGDAEGKLAGFGKKAGGILKGGMQAAGIAAAAALAKGLYDGIEQGRLQDKLAAQLGLTEAESARVGGVAGRLYADAYGGSLEEVNGAIAAVGQSLVDLETVSDEELSKLSAHALDYAATFDADVNEVTQAAGTLLKNGLAADGEEAFDLLVAASQNMSAATRDELLAATNEYSGFFAQLGLDGADAMGLLASASGDGFIAVDKVGDALKELTIRGSDMSEASVKSYEAAGLAADDMSRRFLAGGDDAAGAMSDLVDGLLAIEDPVEQANAAIGLFGTPLEDLGTDQIPAFLAGLDDGAAALGDFGGAASRMGDTLNNNAATKIEAFKRKGMQGLANFMAGTVIPAMENFAPKAAAAFETLRAKALPIIENFKAKWDVIWPQVQATFQKVMEALGPVLADAKAAFESAWEAISVATETIVKVLMDLWDRFGDDYLTYLTRTLDNVAQAFEGVFKTIKGIFDTFAAVFKGDWKGVWEGIKTTFSGVWDTLGAVVQQAFDVLNVAWDAFKGVFTSAWSATWNGAKTLFNDVWGGIERAFITVINKIISVWNSLNFEIPEVDIPVIGKVGGGTVGVGTITPIGTGPTRLGTGTSGVGYGNVQRSAFGGATTAGESYLVGEKGPELWTAGANGRITPNHAIGGTVINLTVYAGMGTNGADVGRQIVDALRSFERSNGRVFAPA